MRAPVRVYSYAQCVGAVLRYFRETRGLTQAGFAKKAGVSQAFLSRAENGTHGSSLGLLLAWSTAMRVPLGTVFTLADRVRFGMNYGTHCIDSGWSQPDGRIIVRCTAEELVEVARRKNDGTINP